MILLAHGQHLYTSCKQIEVADSGKTPSDSSGDRILLLLKSIRIGLHLSCKLSQDFSLLLVVVLAKARIVHARQFSRLRCIRIPRPGRGISRVTDDQGERTRGRDPKMVHGLAGQELANGGPQDRPAIGSPAERSLARALELELIPRDDVRIQFFIVNSVTVDRIRIMRYDYFCNGYSTTVPVSCSIPVGTVIGISSAHDRTETVKRMTWVDCESQQLFFAFAAF